MATQAVISAGHITDEAKKFLEQHGATIEDARGLFLVTLPEGAEIAYPSSGSGLPHTIDWNGEIEWPWVAIDLNINALETRITLKKDDAQGKQEARLAQDDTSNEYDYESCYRLGGSYHQFLESTIDDAEYNAYLDHIHTPRVEEY